MRLRTRRRHRAGKYLVTASVGALTLSLTLTGASAEAQTPVSPAVSLPAMSSPEVAEVVVTATRVERQGYTGPTPTTSIGLDQIQQQAPANLADLINEVPALSTSSTPLTPNAQGFASAGMNLLNLRDLGPNRTLVLLDGMRPPPSNSTLNVDINLLPTELVKRVDVVTGGASADWGSDAVAGVVNFVLDKEFIGLKGYVQGGESQQSDDKSVEAALSYGTAFADGKGHIEFSAKYMDQGEVAGPDYSGRSWYHGDKVLANPNGSNTRVLLPNVGLSSGTDGGLITAGPLRGTQFIGTAGSPVPFNFGFVSGAESYGGSAEDDGGRIQLQDPEQEGNFFGRISYNLNSNVTAFVQFSYAQSALLSQGVPYNRLGNITILSGDPYIPSSVQAQMTALGLSSFTLGKVNQQFGFIENHNTVNVYNVVAGLEGTFGSGWRWGAYYQHAENSELAQGERDGNIAHYNAAVNAVSGPNGQIVCASSLTNPSNGCVPFNPFGTGDTAAAVVNYLTGTAWQQTDIDQDDFSLNLRGNPFSSWAGLVSIATGYEFRRESLSVNTDPTSQSNGWFLNYGTPASGSYSVNEAYLETVFPLLSKMPLAKELDFNGAVRVTDYSESGVVDTWKLGLTYDVVDDIRFRGTISRDIRAPSLQDLFATGITTSGALTDPKTKTSYQINQTSIGNRNLTPEIAKTTSGGVVFQPHQIRNLSMSIDYWNITINNAITTPAAQTILNQCGLGDAAACALVTRGANGLVTNIAVSPLNIQTEAESGIDFALNYRLNLSSFKTAWRGSLSFAALATNTISHKVTLLGTTIQYAGTDGDGAYADPSWRALFTTTYEDGPFVASADVRYIGAGVISYTFPVIVNNNVPAIAYTDLSLSYKLPNGLQVYGVIDNLLNQSPPPSPQVTLAPHLNLGVDDYIYDTIGRVFRVGVRFKY